jgi:hypothetical protein
MSPSGAAVQQQQQPQQAFMSAQQFRSGGGGGGGGGRTDVSPDGGGGGGGRGSRSPRSPGGALSPGGRSNRVTPAPLALHAAVGLPGVAPSPHNSPSHVTAESESKHVSQLSLREKTVNHAGSGAGGGGPASPAGLSSRRDGRLSHSGLDLAHNGGGGSSSPIRSPQPHSHPAPPALSPSPSPAAKGGAATVLATLLPHEASNLFQAHEYLHALPPTLFAPGTKVQASMVFPAALLHETLRDATRCPIVVFLTAVDQRSAMQLGSGGGGAASPGVGPLSAGATGVRTGGGCLEALVGELTIVQFAPPPSQSAAAAAAARALAALPAPAITTAIPAAEDGPAAGADGEAKEDGDDAAEEKREEPASPTVTSPNAALNDSYTCRAKFDRQLIVTPDHTFEMEVRGICSAIRGAKGAGAPRAGLDCD